MLNTWKSQIQKFERIWGSFPLFVLSLLVLSTVYLFNAHSIFAKVPLTYFDEPAVYQIEYRSVSFSQIAQERLNGESLSFFYRSWYSFIANFTNNPRDDYRFNYIIVITYLSLLCFLILTILSKNAPAAGIFSLFILYWDVMLWSPNRITVFLLAIILSVVLLCLRYTKNFHFAVAIVGFVFSLLVIDRVDYVIHAATFSAVGFFLLAAKSKAFLRRPYYCILPIVSGLVICLVRTISTRSNDLSTFKTRIHMHYLSIHKNSLSIDQLINEKLNMGTSIFDTILKNKIFFIEYSIDSLVRFFSNLPSYLFSFPLIKIRETNITVTNFPLTLFLIFFIVGVITYKLGIFKWQHNRKLLFLLSLSALVAFKTILVVMLVSPFYQHNVDFLLFLIVSLGALMACQTANHKNIILVVFLGIAGLFKPIELYKKSAPSILEERMINTGKERDGALEAITTLISENQHRKISMFSSVFYHLYTQNDHLRAPEFFYINKFSEACNRNQFCNWEQFLNKRKIDIVVIDNLDLFAIDYSDSASTSNAKMIAKRRIMKGMAAVSCYTLFWHNQVVEIYLRKPNCKY